MASTGIGKDEGQLQIHLTTKQAQYVNFVRLTIKYFN